MNALSSRIISGFYSKKCAKTALNLTYSCIMKLKGGPPWDRFRIMRPDQKSPKAIPLVLMVLLSLNLWTPIRTAYGQFLPTWGMRKQHAIRPKQLNFGSKAISPMC